MIQKIKRIYEIAKTHGLSCSLHSFIDFILIEYGDIYFDRALSKNLMWESFEPLELLWVDPQRITYYQPNFLYHSPKYDTSDFDNSPVLGGSWDRLRSRFHQTIFFRSLDRHFHRDVPWEETIFIKRRLDELSDDQNKWGVKSATDIQKRCNEVEELYNNIYENGFCLQSDRGGEPEEDVLVNIGRNEELILVSGRHRVAIATILELDQIPVRVLVRHKK